MSLSVPEWFDLVRDQLRAGEWGKAAENLRRLAPRIGTKREASLHDRAIWAGEFLAGDKWPEVEQLDVLAVNKMEA